MDSFLWHVVYVVALIVLGAFGHKWLGVEASRAADAVKSEVTKNR